MERTQKTIIFNAKAGGFAEHGAANATVNPFHYLVGVTEQFSENRAYKYANGELVGSVPGIMKITGELRTTAPEPKLEEMTGLEIETTAGVARTMGRIGKRIDFHYAYDEQDERGVIQSVKVWLLNLEIGRPVRLHETKQENVTTAEYAYPYTCYGVKMLKSGTSTEVYVDENGMEVTVQDVERRPGEDGYDTFFETVPVPRETEAEAETE